MSEEAQSQEYQVSVKMANISDLDKREEQKIEVYALMAFRNTRVLVLKQMASMASFFVAFISHRIQDMDTL